MIIYPDGPSINFVNSILEKDIIKRIPSDYSLNLLISSEAKLEENNKMKSSNKSINVNNIQRDLINLLNYECESGSIFDKNDKQINNLNQGYFDNRKNSESISNIEETPQLIIIFQEKIIKIVMIKMILMIKKIKMERKIWNIILIKIYIIILIFLI